MYSFYWPSLTFRDDGTCFGEFTDNNGPFTINGQFENEHFCFTKSYSGALNIYYVGKFTGDRLNMVYSFTEGETDDLKTRADNGEMMAWTQFSLNYYTFELDFEQSPTFLIEDGKKMKGFVIHLGKLNFISLKTKEGKKTKLKMKRGDEIRYVKCDLDHDQHLIMLADMPMGMGL